MSIASDSVAIYVDPVNNLKYVGHARPVRLIGEMVLDDVPLQSWEVEYVNDPGRLYRMWLRSIVR